MGTKLGEGERSATFLLREAPGRVLKVFTGGETLEGLRELLVRWASVDHPNVVRLHDFGGSPEGPWALLERVDGASCAALLDAGRELPPADHDALAAFSRDALGGLEALHRAGLIHGALTPRQLLFARSGELKLTDPGLAAGGPKTALTEYLAPEQLAGAGPTVLSDLYSAAASLTHLATQASPFRFQTEQETRDAAFNGQRAERLERLLALDERWGFALMRAFVDDPAQRFLSAEAFALAVPQPTERSAAAAERWVRARLDLVHPQGD